MTNSQRNDSHEEMADLASIFPRKGDSRRPPEWYTRALLYAVIAVFLAIFAWRAGAQLGSVALNIVISLFVAFAIEPIVRWLILHGWKRNVSTGITLLAIFVLIAAFIGVFGNLLVQQVVAIFKGLPSMYAQLSDLASSRFNYTLPQIGDLSTSVLSSMEASTLSEFTSKIVSTLGSALSSLLNFITIVLVTYYMSAYGPNMRKVICHYMPQDSQKRFLVVWTVAQDQISGFLYSRIVLAVINAICLSIFMLLMHIPNWLPLAIACGLISQFVPMIGTYIGGALPAIFAWGSNGIWAAVWVIVFIVVYQQIENNLISPAVTRSTMDLNPAIALLSVFIFSAIWGTLGGFLALPITASIQALLTTYLKRYELVDSELLGDPKPEKKSKLAQSVEQVSETMSIPLRNLRRNSQDDRHVTAEDLIRFREAVEGSDSVSNTDLGVQEFLERTEGESVDSTSEEKTHAESDESNSSVPSSAAPIKPARKAKRRSHNERDDENATDYHADKSAQE